MVSRVYGKCDGYTIIFAQNPQTGRWETTVPFDTDGEYIVEVRAIDDCGNESYYATLLFTVDTTKLCVKIKILNLSAQAKTDEIFSNTQTNKYQIHVSTKELYKPKVQTNDWKAEIIKCELCGRF